MPRPAFTAKFRLWSEWLADKKALGKLNSPYVKGIIEAHKAHPDKSLKALRTLSKAGRVISKLPIKALTGQEREERNAALRIVHSMQPYTNKKGEVKPGRSLREAVRINNDNPSRIKMSENKVKSALGKALQRGKGKGGRFTINPNERLETRHIIYTNGRKREITLPNQRERNILSEYRDDLKKLLYKGWISPEEFSEKWKGKTVKDARGKEWKLESNYSILEKLESEGKEYYISTYAK